MNILERIADHARARVISYKKLIPEDEMRRMAADSEPVNGTGFYGAVARKGMSFICEIKKASPSKGLIDPVFDYLSIAEEYDAAGADCISCLTEPKWFLGSDSIFREIRARNGIPMLRKDFVVDRYQLYQSKTLGADCVLLICALLEPSTLAEYLDICGTLGIAALVETHDETEIVTAIAAGAKMIGVNNRDLRDFSVDLENSARLRERVPADCLFVAESGVKICPVAFTPGTPSMIATAHIYRLCIIPGKLSKGLTMFFSMLVSALVFFTLWFALGDSFSNHALWLAFLSYLGTRSLMQTLLFRI